MGALPRVFATHNLPGGALARLARRVSLEVWPNPGFAAFAQPAG